MSEQGIIQFDEFATQLDTFFDRAETVQDGVIVERDGKLFTLKPKTQRKKKPQRHLTMDDSLWDIVGIGHSDEPGDVATNKHKYVADALASHWSDEGATPDTSAKDKPTPTHGRRPA